MSEDVIKPEFTQVKANHIQSYKLWTASVATNYILYNPLYTVTQTVHNY